MATHKSSEKRARQTIRRNLVNRNRRTTIHTLVRSVEEAIASNNPQEALKALRLVESTIARNAGKGLLHKKTAARKTSRLAQRVRKISRK